MREQLGMPLRIAATLVLLLSAAAHAGPLEDCQQQQDKIAAY